MPEISRFYGIIIRMFFNDHLPPHFHASYPDYSAQIDIRTGDIINGELPRRALRLVQDWTELHRPELIKNYNESQKEGAIQIDAANISFLRNFGTYDKHSCYQYCASTRLVKSHRDEILVGDIYP